MNISNLFSDEKVNVGRQVELDIAKALAIIFMIFLHTVMVVQGYNDGLSGKADSSSLDTLTATVTYTDNSTDTVDIRNDYVYSESDNKIQLVFNQSNLVINGNNHVIDGSNKAQGFIFKNNKLNVTINDLTFVNCNQSVNVLRGNITLNNVNFTNNFNSESLKGIITIEIDGKLILNNCNFNSNINSSLICMLYSDVAIYNSHFYNTHSGMVAPIYVNRNELTIENCTFENLSS